MCAPDLATHHTHHVLFGCSPHCMARACSGDLLRLSGPWTSSFCLTFNISDFFHQNFINFSIFCAHTHLFLVITTHLGPPSPSILDWPHLPPFPHRLSIDSHPLFCLSSPATHTHIHIWPQAPHLFIHPPPSIP